jgi:hypothetical protein
LLFFAKAKAIRQARKRKVRARKLLLIEGVPTEQCVGRYGALLFAASIARWPIIDADGRTFTLFETMRASINT